VLIDFLPSGDVTQKNDSEAFNQSRVQVVQIDWFGGNQLFFAHSILKVTSNQTIYDCGGLHYRRILEGKVN
jgi:hypothetical protein